MQMPTDLNESQDLTHNVDLRREGKKQTDFSVLVEEDGGKKGRNYPVGDITSSLYLITRKPKSLSDSFTSEYERQLQYQVCRTSV